MYLKNKGFTLVEILTVISIIIILIALLSPAFRSAMERAKIDKAKAMIASLEVAINMYYTDIGSYPLAANWGNVLTSKTLNYGPYMDTKDFVSGNFQDPWGNDYHYAQPGGTNTNSFDVYSNGPDEQNDNGLDDDIGNW